MYQSLHIEFDEFNGNIIFWSATSTDPQFNIVSCCIGQAFYKPWRVVELTARAIGSTILIIPENVIRKEYTKITGIPLRVQTTLTEVITFNKGRDNTGWCSITRAAIIWPHGSHFT